MEGGVLTRRNCRKQSGPAGKVWKPVKFIRDGQLLLFLTALAVLVPVHARAADEGGNETGAPAFENVIRLPQDLYTQDGRLLEQGMYLVRAQFDEERPILVFESSDLEKTTIEGKPRERIRQGAPNVPIAGTMFLRSTDNPVGTDAQRHHSKTGHPQYQETERDWKAALRMYRHADTQKNDVLLLFQRRLPGACWESIEYRVFSSRP